MADTTPTPAPDVFDEAAQASAAQTAPTQSAPAGAPQATGSNGDIFDQLAANNTNNSTGQSSATATATAAAPAYYPPAISAVQPPANMAGRVARWASQVQHDLEFGTDSTGLGTVLARMGAHGVYMGNPAAVGDALASIPLGAAKTIQGGAEMLTPGSRVQGMKDTVSGLAQAATIPGSFVAPEAGEAASSAVTTGAKVAAKPFAKVISGFDPASVQGPLQQAIRDVVASVAKDAGVTVNPASSVRDVVSQVADAVLQKSTGLYKQLDAATGGRFQRFDDALTNINRAIRETTGLDDEAEASLIQKKAQVEAAQHAAFEAAKASGTDPKLVDAASGLYKQGQALHDVAHLGVRGATRGLRPELAGPGSTPETINPAQAFQRLSKLYDSGRLQQAVGSDRAGSLLQAIDDAFVGQARIEARIKNAKTLAKVAGVGGAAAAAGQGAHLVKDVLQ